MTKISFLLFFVSWSIPLLINSQDIDPNFCDINNLPAGPDKLDPPIYDLNTQYQTRIEKNSKNLGETQEIHEYYDGVNNIGVSINRFGGNTVRTYSYYDTDELFLVKDDKCSRFKISESLSNGLSEFLLIPDGNNKEKIASLLTLILSSKSVNLVYTGSGNFIRGIPVDEWQTCIFSNFDKKSLKVTISFTRSIWKPAYPLNDNTSIPIQLIIESKDSNGIEDTTIYTFTQFRPFLDQDMEEKEHLIPRGIYCQDKINTRDLPAVPNAFRYESQYVEPTAFQHHNRSQNVDVRSIREEYNYNSKLYRLDFYKDNNINSEILDFNTGVKYIYNSDGKCKIDMIDANRDFMVAELGSDGLIKMKNSSEFFHFDGGNFQFSGSRDQEGVNTDLWIGRRDIFNTTANVEWYFLSQKWNNTDQASVTPILLRTLQEVKSDNGSILIRPRSKYFFNFRTKNLMLRDFDLSVCADQNKRKSFFIQMQVPFNTAREIYRNRIQFSEAFVSFIEEIAKVTPLRVADITVDFDDDSTLIYFNIFERVKNYGKVTLPKNDVSLDDAVGYLKDYFSNDNNVIELSFKNNLEGVIKIKAINSTFNESIGQVINAGYNAGSTAAATIMSLSIGLLIALLIVTLQKFKKINIPFLG